MPEITYRGFKGINNRSEEFALRHDELLQGVNCDLDNDLILSRREGATLRVAGSMHSFFAAGDLGLYRSGTALFRLNDDLTGTALGAGLVAGRKMRYSPLPPGRIAMSDGVYRGITDGSRAWAWGIDLPAAQPEAAQTSGALPPGRYQYAVTFRRADGEESGTPRARVAAVTGGLQFTNIPVSSNPDVTEVLVYVSPPDSAALRHALTLTNGTTSATFSASPATLGAKLDSQFVRPPRPGYALANYNGRALVADGPFLQYSEFWRPERFLEDSYTAFTAGVRFVAPVTSGVFVGTGEEVAFLAGDDIAAASYRRVATCAAVRDSVHYVNGDLVGKDGFPGVLPIFATSHGLMLGTEDGNVVNLTNTRYDIAATTLAAAVVRRSAGDRYIAILR